MLLSSNNSTKTRCIYIRLLDSLCCVLLKFLLVLSGVVSNSCFFGWITCDCIFRVHRCRDAKRIKLLDFELESLIKKTCLRSVGYINIL